MFTEIMKDLENALEGREKAQVSDTNKKNLTKVTYYSRFRKARGSSIKTPPSNGTQKI
jgi:hypothetical protein